MCDYSLKHVKSRDAAKEDQLITHDFGAGTKGFMAKDDPTVAVCVRPGTEIAFAEPVRTIAYHFADAGAPKLPLPQVATFRQVNTELEMTHHDALEFADGQMVLLTQLREGQYATVVAMSAEPRTEAEAKAQERVPVTA